MLPTPTPEHIPIQIAGHVFVFRRLTWRDEMAFHEMHTTRPKLSQLAYATLTVDDRPLRLEDADRLISSLPRPVRERLVVLYRGSLPDNRLPEAEVPYHAPEPKVVQAAVIAETEDTESRAEELLEQRFGKEEANHARELAEAIARSSGMRGATKPLDSPENVMEESTTIVPPEPPKRYAAVM